MLIEKTTIISFDEVAERERILTVFKAKKYDAVRPKLLAILDDMVAGEWKEMLIKCIELSRDEREYLAIPISNIAQDLNDRVVRMGQVERHAKLDTETAKMLEMSGIPTGAIRADYPKFKVLPTAAAPAA